MQKYFFILILSRLSSVLLGQNTSIDSLINALNKSQHDTSRIEIYNRLSEKHLLNLQFEAAMKYAKYGLLLSKNADYKKGLSSSFNHLGHIYLTKGNYDSAEVALLESIKLSLEIRNKKLSANTYILLGNVYLSGGKYSKSLEGALSALQLYDELGDKEGKSNAYGNIGNVYFKQRSYSNALEKYLIALKLKKETGDKIGEARMYNNIGNIYNLQLDLGKALEYYNRALAIREEMGDKKGIASTNNKLGIIYQKQGRYKEALTRFLLSQEINEEMGYKQALSQDYVYLGLGYMDIKDYKKSDYFLSKALELATKMKDNNRLKDVYLSIAEVNERRGDYKTAYKFHRLFSAMNDTLFSKDYSKQVAEMTTKYETEKKDKELIRKDFEFKEQQKQKNYLMVFSISSLVVLLVLLLSLLFFKKANTKIKSKNEQLKKQNYEIEQKKEEINKQAVQIAKYQSQMNPHFIFNAINGIQSIVLKEDKIKAVQQIQSLSKLLRTTLNNSESEFISLEEEKSYLYKYIEFELHRFANKFKFSFIVDEGISYKATIPTMIIQPFIENAIKHGELNNLKNGEISVYIKPHPEFKERLITISIRDNGAGIQIKNEKSETQKHQSKGLKITKSRLLLELKKSNLVISNYFNIKSPIFETGPNFGTEVVITAPFHKT